PPPSVSSPLSLHDALPISPAVGAAPRAHARRGRRRPAAVRDGARLLRDVDAAERGRKEVIRGQCLMVALGCRLKASWAVIRDHPDRKSTRLNSSHLVISYA